MEQFPAMNPNPVINVVNDGVILYSNEAGEPLLNEWDVKVGEKLPFHIGNIVQKVLSQNSPEKMEVKAGNRTYLVVFSPFPEQNLVNISGFDNRCWEHQTGLEAGEEALRVSEEKYHSLFENMTERFQILEPIFDDDGKPIDFRYIEINKASAELAGKKREEIEGKTAKELWGVVEDYWIEMLGGVLKTSKPVDMVNYSGEFDLYHDVHAWKVDEYRVAILFSDITERKRAEEALCRAKAELESRVLERTAELQKSNDDLNIQITERKQIEEALRESDERFQIAQELSPDGFAIIRPLRDDTGVVTDFLWIYENDAAAQMNDTNPKEVCGKKVSEVMPHHDQSPFGKAYKEVAETGEVRVIEEAFYDQDTFRQQRWFRAAVVPITGGDVAILVQNITKRKQAEEALRESEHNLEEANRQKENILESISDCFYALDKDFRFIYVNKAAEEIWGLSRADLIGRKIEDVFTGLIDISLSKFHQVVEEQVPQRYEVYSKVIQRWGYMNVYPSQEGLSIYFHDITERKRAEEASQERERMHAFQSAILESVHDPLWATDSGLRVVYWNDAATAMFGWTADEVQGRHTGELFRTLVPGSTHDDAVAQLLQTGEFHGEIVCHCKDGSPILAEASSRIVRGPDGEVIRVVSTARDITESKREEEHERFVRDLLNEIASMSSSKEILHRTCQALGEYLRVGNVHMADMDEETDTARAYQGFTDQTVPPLEGEWPNVSSFWHPEMTAAFRNGMTVVVRNAQHHPWTIAEKYAPTGVAAFVTVPFIEKGGWRHFISVISAEPRDWREDEIRVAERVTRGVFPHLQRARASEELRASELMYRSLSNTLEEKVRERTEELEKAYKFLQEIEIVRKQEIHHRIKNNLQVISSLLDLQAEKFRGKKNIEDSQVLESFKESQDRVISMALIHEELYKGGKLDTLNFSTYAQELADNLFLSYRLGNEGTSLSMDIVKDIFFDMDTAVSLGIIINELVSNSLKHAFFDRDNGEITIRLYRQNGECGIEDSKSTNFTLSVVDNGVGIPEDLDMEDLDSLGLQLVTTLVDQLEGELELKNNKGTEFTIRFTVPESNNPILAKHSLQLTDND